MNFPLRESIYIERPVRFRGCVPSVCNIVPHFHMPTTQCLAPFSILSWSSIVGKRQGLDRSYRRGILVARLCCGEETRSPILDCLHKCSGYWNFNIAVFGGRRPCFMRSLVNVCNHRVSIVAWSAFIYLWTAPRGVIRQTFLKRSDPLSRTYIGWLNTARKRPRWHS